MNKTACAWNGARVMTVKWYRLGEVSGFCMHSVCGQIPMGTRKS